MPHVMVPVPEEHLGEFTAGLMRLILGVGGWEEAELTSFVAGLEPAARALVEAVARVSVDQDRLPYEDAAATLGTDVGAVLDLVTDINERCRRADLPLPLVTDTMVATRDGQERATPVLVIPPMVASAFLAAMAGDRPG